VKEHKIATVEDIFALSEDELARFLPDLVHVHFINKIAQQEGADPIKEFVWIDDGDVGTKYVDFVNKDTGETVRHFVGKDDS